ncbi:MAG: deoxyribodipyrimidine photo-lyase [Thermoleophilia bacterium]|nr:deoxyribodipyrimidine photo-lyase [Thermoleophilia bacterium]
MTATAHDQVSAPTTLVPTGAERASKAAQTLASTAALVVDPTRIVGWNDAVGHDPSGRCVVWWMAHAQRGHDNLVGDVAVTAADALQLPLVVIFKLGAGPVGTQLRHVDFMVRGLPEAFAECSERGAHVVLVDRDGPTVADFLQQLRPALVITDHDVMPKARATRARVGAQLRVPVIGVDTDVVVPMANYDKAEYAARTIRPKIHRVLERYLVPEPAHAAKLPPSPRPTWLDDIQSTDVHLVDRKGGFNSTAIDTLLAHARGVATIAQPVPGLSSGPAAARTRLEAFIGDELHGYATRRNKPEIDGTSRLSSFLHFGQLSPHAVVRAVRAASAPGADIDAFVEEFVVRRELAVNHVLFTPTAGTFASIPNWANKTLAAHRADPREWIYSRDQLEACATHDPLWNAAQRQMQLTGHMHGYLRMYWAKKVLEWSRDAETAFNTTLEMNDCWHLDGRDPNGIVGVAWAIGGLHDRPWGEREIFGMVRYMSLASTGRKFDSKSYIRRWTSGDEAPTALF